MITVYRFEVRVRVRVRVRVILWVSGSCDNPYILVGYTHTLTLTVIL
jgi:hypothetical protein